MFLNNHWYVAATVEELSQKPIARTICGIELVIFRNAEGTVGVLEDRCPHRQAPLSLGNVVDNGLQCGYHGAIFNKDGACVEIPCQPGLREAGLEYYRARSYPVVEAHSFIFVWIGNPEQADLALLPNWGCHTTADHIVTHGFHHVHANYQLLLDNLNDLTHLTYVHKTTLGQVSGPAWTAVLPDVQTIGNTVRTSRIMRDQRVAPMVRAIREFGPDETSDRFQTSEFSPPCFMAVVLGAERTQPRRDSMDVPTHIVLNALTPESETSTHYFWCISRTESPDPSVSKTLHGMVKEAFDEDALMIEAQQKRISTAPDRPLKNFSSDRAVESTRRIIARLLAEQASPPPQAQK